jgi:ribonuclease VapC
MVIDRSALVAIIGGEPETSAMLDAIEIDPIRWVSAATLVETSIVLQSLYGTDAVDDFDIFVIRIGAEIIHFDEDQARIARDAFNRFGKGRHAAALNFGDCFAYALAKSRDEPLLFKGHDFSKTDITAVLGG